MCLTLRVNGEVMQNSTTADIAVGDVVELEIPGLGAHRSPVLAGH